MARSWDDLARADASATTRLPLALPSSTGSTALRKASPAPLTQIAFWPPNMEIDCTSSARRAGSDARSCSSKRRHGEGIIERARHLLHRAACKLAHRIGLLAIDQQGADGGIGLAEEGIEPGRLDGRHGGFTTSVLRLRNRPQAGCGCRRSPHARRARWRWSRPGDPRRAGGSRHSLPGKRSCPGGRRCRWTGRPAHS